MFNVPSIMVSEKSILMAMIVFMSYVMDGNTRIVPSPETGTYYQTVPETGKPVEDPEWGYSEADGPHTWARNFPVSCTGQKQSPIDLLPESAAHLTVPHHKKDRLALHHRGFASLESTLDIKAGDLFEFGADTGLDLDVSGDHLSLGADTGVDTRAGSEVSISGEAGADLDVIKDGHVSLGADLAVDQNIGDFSLDKVSSLDIGVSDKRRQQNKNWESKVEGSQKIEGPINGVEDMEANKVEDEKVGDEIEGQVLAFASTNDFTLAMNLSGTLVNNGHTVEFRPLNQPKLVVNSQILKNQTFQLLQIHFHWGPTQGSEHTLAGRRLPMEMHAVHLNVKYAKTPKEEWSQHSDALLVLGFLIEVASQTKGNQDPKELQQFTFGPIQPFVKGIQEMEKDGSKQVEISGVNLMGFAKSVRFNQFYHYSGSLTTPPCTEVVSWVVFDKPVVIGDSQAEAFRTFNLQGGSSLGRTLSEQNLFRPTQPVNGRKVFHYMPESIASAATYVLGMRRPRTNKSRKASEQNEKGTGKREGNSLFCDYYDDYYDYYDYCIDDYFYIDYYLY